VKANGSSASYDKESSAYVARNTYLNFEPIRIQEYVTIYYILLLAPPPPPFTSVTPGLLKTFFQLLKFICSLANLFKENCLSCFPQVILLMDFEEHKICFAEESVLEIRTGHNVKRKNRALSARDCECC
jgi:hypothetical protein